MVVYQIVTELKLLPGDITFPQISVIVRLISLPTLCRSNLIECYTDLSKWASSHGFVKLSGIVLGATAISSYTQSTRYVCPDEECEGHHGNQYIRVHITGASEAQTIRNDFSCTVCWRHLEEEKSCRHLSEKMVIDIVPSSVLSTNRPETYRSQAVPVYLRDELTRGIEIGECYQVIGLVRKDIKGDNIMLAMEANNIKKSDSAIPCQTDRIPMSIKELYEGRKCSPWSFVLSLSFFFADQVCPPGTYLRLKMYILLSLVSQRNHQKSKYSHPLHLLAVGDDTNLIHKLYLYGQKFTTRSCVHSSRDHMTGKVTCDKYESAPYYIEGGSFHMAKNGVCYLGNLNKYKKSVKEQIQTAIGQNKFTLGISSKLTGGLPQQLEETLSCDVWGYTDTHPQRRNNNDLFLGQDVNDVSKRLFDCFSVVHYVDSGPANINEAVSIQCAHHEMTSAMGENQQSIISDNDFHLFLKYVSGLCPTMTSKCENLIHGYYLASRKARTSDSNSMVPVSTLQTLYSLAVSHAKLSLRQEVSVDDGLMAIWVYEESLTSRLGHSILSVQPCPHVPSDGTQQYLGKENDNMMRQFHVNLLRFCTNQASWEE